MGLFRGRRHRGADDGDSRAGLPDDALPVLNVRQAALVRSLVHRELAEHGIEASIHATHLTTDTGVEFGLWNIAATCAQERREQRWTHLVHRHVRSLLAAQSPTVPQMDERTPEFLLEHVILRVVARDAFGQAGPPEYARDLTEDLVEVLAVDLPTSVEVIPQRTLAQVPYDRLQTSGLEHLVADPLPRPEFVDLRDLLVQGPGLGRVPRLPMAVVQGTTVHTASHILTMPDLLRRTLDGPDTRYGVLVAVPTRDVVLLHVLDRASVAPATAAMARFTRWAYDRHPGSLSGRLLWWNRGRIEPVAHVTGEGTIAVDGTGEFGRLIDPGADHDDD